MRMGVVADDITGSNDIGIMFAKAGCRTLVYTYEEPGDFSAWQRTGPEADITILNTNTRLADRERAYRRVYSATQELAKAGCRRFFNKTCSVFRGNIGAEFDAMLDALGQEFAVVVLGFPKNGRTTVDGIHYVRGKRLEDSEFRNDPIHPMTRSDLVGILQSQTRRKVAGLVHEVIERGPAVLKAEIARLRLTCNYLILDVTGQEALRTIAQAVDDQAVLCGSSALAEELPAVWGGCAQGESNQKRPLAMKKEAAGGGFGTLCLAGSLMPQTIAQVGYLAEHGAVDLELDGRRIFDAEEYAAEVERLTAAAARDLAQGRDVIVHSAQDPAQVEATRALGREKGWETTRVARQVETALSEVAARTLERTRQSRLVVAGGETSAAVCARLGVRGVEILREIQPGLPSCLALGPRPLWLVLKSGSFGSPEFLTQAIQHLQEVTHGD